MYAQGKDTNGKWRIRFTLKDISMTLKERQVATTVERFLAQREEFYEDIPEYGVVNFEPEEGDDDSPSVQDDNNSNSQTVSATGHDWRKYILVIIN